VQNLCSTKFVQIKISSKWVLNITTTLYIIKDVMTQ
jgi:hypothetical protein